MSLDQYFAKEWESIPDADAAAAAAADSENTPPCFDCNICLDFVHDPVITLCGHLYCWPCIYKWFHYQSSSLASDEHPQCPVCKADVSHTTVVPLYSRGQTPSSAAESEGMAPAPYQGIGIPPRPPALGAETLTTTSNPGRQVLSYRNPYQNPHFPPQPYSSSYEEDSSPPFFNLGESSTMGPFNSVAGMFGETVYARLFGNLERLYTHPNSFHLVGGTSPILRRQQMQANKFLSRILLFLFCCFLLCFLLF